MKATHLEQRRYGLSTPGAIEFLKSPAPKRMLIGGQWVAAQSGKTFESIDPATEQVLAQIAEGDAADIDAAVKAARRAFEHPSWSAITPAQRGAYLHKIADVIERHFDELVELESIDNGMTVSTMRWMVGWAIETWRYYAGWPTKIYGDTNPTAPGVFSYTLREPLGVVGAITPWNGPVAAAALKLAPALACGNTAVLKPAEQAQLAVLRFGELLQEIGLPEGVINIVTGFGPGAGSSLTEHPGVDKVGFTGSTEVGKIILRASSGNLKRVSLELGGKSPNIIFPDADLDEAVQTARMGFCFMNGQGCALGTRIFVHESIYDEFAERLKQFTQKLKIGDPLDPEAQMGPLGFREQLERVTSYMDLGRREGAVAKLGGRAMQGKGYYVEPTIFTQVQNSMRIAREEIFGPVAALIPFRDEEDAAFQGNDSIYGLGAAVWTRDLNRALRMARALQAGQVWINCYTVQDLSAPFGGYKQSGIGSEYAKTSIEMYTQQKAVFVKL
jgi:acyl-CoA reductase-like NAD-dependent aldehyde dehydrogenase